VSWITRVDAELSSAPIYEHSRARRCARYALTQTLLRYVHSETGAIVSTRRSHSRINGALFSLILAFRDSGQSPTDF